MDTYLHKNFYSYINRILNFSQSSSILIAVSGGQDSLCLIKLIQDFVNKYQRQINISYIYIDHQWKADSKQQIKHLINLLNIKQTTVSIYQIREIPNSELEARNIRYKIIIQHAMKYNYSVIMTGHTNTDQIETFLLQLIRGNGIDAVTSLNKHRLLHNHLRIIRPLINFKRSDITWFCRKFTLPIWSDISNYEYNISRNRLRNELLPYLNKYFVFNIEKQINYFLRISDIENEYIRQNAIKLYLKSRHKTNIALNYRIIKQQHQALQVRVLQIFIYHNFNKTLNRSILNRLLILIKKNKNNTYILKWKNLHFKINLNWLYFY
uniref:tRNA(Ile)-lysidine synthase, chloroplastic n=1 Tax=Sarcopeltis skottsbergii TaxID=2765380 RepID=A0A7M1VMQ9_SARSK|nr:tRNA-Ile-lysidine synthase [Sarcopeltis skottsbergii]